MKDFDLKSKMKALSVPERGEDYWETFPKCVIMELRNVPAGRPAPQAFMPGLFLGSQVALACLMLGFCLWQSRMPGALSHAVRKDEMKLRQSLQRIHNNLGRFMQDEHGMHWLIEEKP